MKNRPLIHPFVALALAIIVPFAVLYSVRSYAQQKPALSFIVVHSDESKTLQWNPATHEELRNETADGNVILTVQPKEK